MRKTIRRLLTALSLLAIGVAIAVLLLGETVLPPVVREQLQRLPPAMLIAIVAWFGLMLWFDRARRRTESPASPLEDEWPEPPSGVTPETAPRVGDDWTAAIDLATSPTAPRHARLEARDRVETELRSIATELYELTHDAEPSRASDAIETGDWTDDRRATALLGGPEAPSPPIYVRLFDLLRPESVYRRRVRHAIHALHGLAAGDGGGAR